MKSDDILTASERLRQMLGPSERLREQLRLLDTPGMKAVAEAERQGLLASQSVRDMVGADRIREISDGMHTWRAAELAHKFAGGEALRDAQGWLDSPTWRAAQEFASSPHMLAASDLAHRAERIVLPGALASYQSSFAMMVDRISVFDHQRLLRAASHHARDFTADDLRDLRVVWRTLEAGLLALTEDIDFDGWQ